MVHFRLQVWKSSEQSQSALCLVNQTLICSLITMGRFKFMDKKFSLNNVTNMDYNLIIDRTENLRSCSL